MPLPAQRLATRPVAWGGLRRAVLSLSAALLALLLGSVSGPLRPAAAAGEPRVVTAADDGRLVNLRRGEQLRVVLNETAGTGYSWDIEHNDPKLLAFEGQHSVQDPGSATVPGRPGVVGGPLQVSFQFRALAKGSGELRLWHWRSWEGPASLDRRFRLRLRVSG